jgi:hypothetical protein
LWRARECSVGEVCHAWRGPEALKWSSRGASPPRSRCQTARTRGLTESRRFWCRRWSVECQSVRGASWLTTTCTWRSQWEKKQYGKKKRRKEKRIRCEYLRWDEVKSQGGWCQSAYLAVMIDLTNHMAQSTITQFLIDVTHRKEATVDSASRKHSDAKVLCSRLDDHGAWQWQQADTRLVVLALRTEASGVGLRP